LYQQWCSFLPYALQHCRVPPMASSSRRWWCTPVTGVVLPPLLFSHAHRCSAAGLWLRTPLVPGAAPSAGRRQGARRRLSSACGRRRAAAHAVPAPAPALARPPARLDGRRARRGARAARRGAAAGRARAGAPQRGQRGRAAQLLRRRRGRRPAVRRPRTPGRALTLLSCLMTAVQC